MILGKVALVPESMSIAERVAHYLRAVAGKRIEEIVSLYASDATVEDPAGGPIYLGHHAIREFYRSALGAADDVETRIITLRVAGHETVFHFEVALRAGDKCTRIDPIDVMKFNEAGQITEMKAFWSPDSVTVESLEDDERISDV